MSDEHTTAPSKQGPGRKRMTTDEFVGRAIQTHGNKYDYSRTQYTLSKNKVEIICPIEGHGLFEQRAGAHLSGDGCQLCADDALKVELPSPNDRVNLNCDKHGQYTVPQRWIDIGKADCRKCKQEARERSQSQLPTADPEQQRSLQQRADENRHRYRKSIESSRNEHQDHEPDEFEGQVEQFIRNAEAKYGETWFDYDSMDFRGLDHPLELVCLCHGPFHVERARDHLGHHGCAGCIAEGT